MSITQGTPKQPIYVHVGAPKPIPFQYRTGGRTGTLMAFDSTLKFQIKTPTSTIVLGVGSGITLSSAEGVADAHAVVQLTVAQSRMLPLGALSSYEVQRVVSGREEVIMMGKLIAEGGDNPDV